GIRDFHVTGVQTCALPILHGVGIAAMDVIPKRLAALHLFVGATRSAGRPDFARTPVSPPSRAAGPRVGGLWYLVSATFRLVRWEIGRASCRERVWMSVGGV